MRIRVQDQPDDAVNINALMQAYKAHDLVAVIAGGCHPKYPCIPPAAYAVLDYFHITDLWKEQEVTEKGVTIKVWRIRFEKADLSKPSWWMPNAINPRPTAVSSTGASPPLDPEEASDGSDEVLAVSAPLGAACPQQTCAECLKVSKKIFTLGWACLNHLCGKYYIFTGVDEPIDINGLCYTAEFLDERSSYSKPIPPVCPQMLDFTGRHGTELVCRQGFVCAHCGCCNSRIFWNQLLCENCNTGQAITMQPYPQNLLDSQVSYLTNLANGRRAGNEPLAFTLNQDLIRPAGSTSIGNYRVSQYYLPDENGNLIGSFTMFTSNDSINGQQFGPNDLFRDLEIRDIGLRRNPAAVAGRKSRQASPKPWQREANRVLDKLEGLTRHFQQNFGARYKFGVSVQSKGFDEAPDVILRALHRLIWASQQAVHYTADMMDQPDLATLTDDEHRPPRKSNEFNELLALGFMEDDRINVCGPLPCPRFKLTLTLKAYSTTMTERRSSAPPSRRCPWAHHRS